MRSAESWWISSEAMILRNILSSDDVSGFGKLLAADQVFQGEPDDKDHAISLYTSNTEEGIDTVDRERLLVHNLGDGWVPLCKWLDLPVLKVDYPYGNTTKNFDKRLAV